MTDYRNVAALILAVMFLQAAAGILSVSTPLALTSMGASPLGVGVVAAIYSAGFMLGAWYASDLVRAVGNIRAYAASAAIFAAAVLGMGLAFDPVAWGAFRFIHGAVSAVMFASAESWIADSTPRQKRGGVMGLYQLLIKLAMSGGPLLAVDHAPDDIKPFIWAGVLLCLALVPLCATQRAQPVPPRRAAGGLSGLKLIPPAAFAGAVVAGVANTGVMSQLPLYAAELRPQDAQAAAATLAIAAWMGGTVTQWPAGLLSDRIDRRFVVAALGVLALAASVALFVLSGRVSWTVTVALAALWGAGALAFYSVSASHATDRTEPADIAQMMSGMLFVWAAGSVIGPVVAGLTADTALGQPGVFAVMAAAYVALILSNLGRMLVVRRPKAADRGAFIPVSQTSVASAELVAEGASDPEEGGIPPN